MTTRDSKIRRALRQDAAEIGNLNALAEDPNAVVREAVASNPRTTRATLRSLATDLDPRVVVAVFLNPATPMSTLDFISDRTSEAVLPTITPDNRAPYLMFSDRYKPRRPLRPPIRAFTVGSNPSTPPGVLSWLANQIRWRRQVALNPSAPPEVLHRLAGHNAFYSPDAQNTLAKLRKRGEIAKRNLLDVIRIKTGGTNLSTSPSRAPHRLAKLPSQNTRKQKRPIVKTSGSRAAPRRLRAWSGLREVAINTYKNTSLSRAMKSNLNFLRTYHTNQPFYKSAVQAVENMTYNNLIHKQKKG